MAIQDRRSSGWECNCVSTEITNCFKCIPSLFFPRLPNRNKFFLMLFLDVSRQQEHTNALYSHNPKKKKKEKDKPNQIRQEHEQRK
mmetsp:Transcript_4300/g.10758  ORF Transcript_4300/g.10758 Transcript_4300/m.10758 type:complete len:86 (-) Transcript_4300:255-512(-)